MKHRTIAVSFALPILALSAFAVSARVGAQEEMGAKPTQHHSLLERSAGTWRVSMDMPTFGVQGSPGTMTSRMLGKFWQIDDYDMEMMGMPFRGLGVTGYDSEKKRYVGMWIDSMNDRMSTFEGTYDEASKTLSFDVPGRNPMTGEEQMERHETKYVSDDEMIFRMLWPDEGGRQQEVMSIRYERKK